MSSKSNAGKLGGRPGVIVLFVNGEKRRWLRSRKPIQVVIEHLSTSGGEIRYGDSVYRAESLPGYPCDGEFRFHEVRESASAPSKYPPGFDADGKNEDGMSVDEATEYHEIIRRGMTNEMEEYWLRWIRDPPLARKFFRFLKLTGFTPQDVDDLQEVKKARASQRKASYELTPEQMAAWQADFDETMRTWVEPVFVNPSTGETPAEEAIRLMGGI